MSIEIDSPALNRVYDRLGHFATLQIMEAPMERSLIKVENAAKEYPDPPAPGEWASKTHIGQKRAFFALLRAGLITGKRTGSLGRRWTKVIIRTGNDMEGRVGNNTTYGPFVMSEMFQARFHQGRWRTERQIVRELRDEIVRDFEETARKAAAS